MKNQLSHWNNAHAQQWLHKHSLIQTDYAVQVEKSLNAKSKVLELGCGEGNDSIFFAEKGHLVTATDFSDIVINQNKERWKNPNLQFDVQDISKPLNYPDGLFDAIYARLSLHYFTDNVTRDIFSEMQRILKRGGTLYFMCKATNDSIYGKGTEIEKDMYELDGHVRHFFSEAYAIQLLSDSGFEVISIVKGEEILYDRVSAYIQVKANSN